MVENERKDDNTGDSGDKSPKKLRVLLRTFGCQMNVRDSEVIAGLLKANDYKLTTNLGEANIIIFNTCSVRQHAEDRVWSEIGRVYQFKRKGQSPAGTVPIIGLVGCMAKEHKERIFERAPQVDFAVGPNDIDKIPAILKKLTANRYPLFATKIWETDGDIRPEEIYHTGFYEDKNHAYIVISEGCSNFCSYCVVPYVRGPLRSRNYKDILKEIEEAVDKGITAITLLGQNVNAYQYDSVNFVGLVNSVNSVKGLKEFSFITSHPKDTSLDLFKAMADLDKLKKYLHLPVQSGSDRILKLMNRGYTREFYLDLVSAYRKTVKAAELTTDIIVGFPTETEEDFQNTYNLLKQIEFDAAYIFKYSQRPHTEAEKLADDVAKEEKERRHGMILALQKEISKKFKTQKSKLKSLMQNLKFLISSCTFAFCLLPFALNCYAMNLDKVKMRFLEGDYKGVISEGEKILANAAPATGLDELYYILGLSYLKDSNFLRASDIFEIIITELDDSAFKEKAQMGLGDTYFFRQDYKNAERYYQRLLEDNPETKFKASVYYRLMQVCLKKGQNQQAKEYIDKLKQDFPLNPEIRLNQELLFSTDLFYTVQVGSFTKPNNARNFCSRLVNKGYAAYIQEAEVSGKKIYRVRIGKLKSQPEAVELEKKLLSEGYPTKIIP